MVIVSETSEEFSMAGKDELFDRMDSLPPGMLGIVEFPVMVGNIVNWFGINPAISGSVAFTEGGRVETGEGAGTGIGIGFIFGINGSVSGSGGVGG